MSQRPFQLIGELINNSFKRAATAFQNRDLNGYQELARLQTARGADYLTVNIDGTQRMMVQQQEMLDFLPDLVPALQTATPLPLAFDHPSLEFHQKALSLYRRTANNRPILNSLAASRQRLDEMIELVAEFDTMVIVMASEKFADGGGARCETPGDVHETAKRFVELLTTRAGRTNDQIIIDPGLAPIACDTQGLVNLGLDAMRLIRRDPDLAGVHLSVGLTNCAFGTPRKVRLGLENAYLTVAHAAGLDFVLGNPEKDVRLLEAGDPYLAVVEKALELGRAQPGESQEEAGFRQAETIMEVFALDRV